MKRKSIRMMYSFGCALIGACMAVSSPALTVFAASPDEQAETAVEVKEAAAPVSTAYRLTQIVIHMGENWRLENALLGKDGNWYISQQTLERYTGYTLDPENMTLRDSSDNLIGIDLEKSTLRTEQSASSVEVSVGALPVYGGQVWFPAHQILPMTGVKADVKEGELYLESYSDSPEKQDRGEPDLSKLGEAVKPEEWKAYWNNYLREILTGEESQNPEEVHLSFADLTGDGTQEMLIAQPAGENYNYEFEAVSFKALRLTDADSRCEEIYEYEYNGYSTLHNDTDIGLCFDGDNKAGILKTDDTVWQGYASSAAEYRSFHEDGSAEEPVCLEWQEARGTDQLNAIAKEFGGPVYLVSESSDEMIYYMPTASALFGYYLDISQWIFEEGEDLSDYVDDGGLIPVDDEPADDMSDDNVSDDKENEDKEAESASSDSDNRNEDLPYAGTETTPFYGIWVYASHNRDDCVAFCDSVDDFAPEIYETTDWSNLNSEHWYVVCMSSDIDQADANRICSNIRNEGYPDAYVKYSGNYQG